jgi:hypothetical protein
MSFDVAPLGAGVVIGVIPSLLFLGPLSDRVSQRKLSR